MVWMEVVVVVVGRVVDDAGSGRVVVIGVEPLRAPPASPCLTITSCLTLSHYHLIPHSASLPSFASHHLLLPLASLSPSVLLHSLIPHPASLSPPASLHSLLPIHSLPGLIEYRSTLHHHPCLIF
ncbi:hypothetical protein Pmani_014746 [Petrolisthes manimaculis]|uniref:Uncharacterized protein n=1 Tax=Petrolisthes manimaculis TaxID=1843537 RepID=A0AAE1PT05_9EUCA|nr:hypothetical protein Pmani_014746 [Petrolisthes manimaculis]